MSDRATAEAESSQSVDNNNGQQQMTRRGGNDDRQVARESSRKRQKRFEEEIHLRDLPSCDAYEKSYMHRETISHLLMTASQFLITCAVDGSLKFWKKTTTGIEFVKLFKSNSSPIQDVSATVTGSELACIQDKIVNIFDVLNFDMINYIQLDFEPGAVEWIEPAALGAMNLAISDSKSNRILIFDARQPTGEPKKVLDSIHMTSVVRMRYNPSHKAIVSVDAEGVIEYWHKVLDDFQEVKKPAVVFESKLETDLYDLMSNDQQSQLVVHDIKMCPDGVNFAIIASDRKVRVFNFATGKIIGLVDENLQNLEQKQKENPTMNVVDFLRKMTIERELEKSGQIAWQTFVFDQSGRFIIYPTLEGIKVINWRTKNVVKYFGQHESIRPLNIALFQGVVRDKFTSASSGDLGVNDPMLFCSAFKKNRFYLFSNRNFEDLPEDADGNTLKDRDIFNEPPTKEEILAAVEIEQGQKLLFENATIHTTFGDIYLKLFMDLAPKAVENFCVHSKNSYYNGHIFHRVIKQFIIQAGDPDGTGTGGESIWGDPFEDEFDDRVNFDEPFILGMANCSAPNTNGSQFFITVAPCSFLQKKHTIFGKVYRGMDVCQNISRVRTDPKTEKPLNDVKIINIEVY